MKILVYNSGGGLGDSIQLFDLITSLKEKYGQKNIFYLSAHKNHFNNALVDYNLHIKDFNPYVYVELPQDIDWSNRSYFYRICDTIDNICQWSTYKPINKELVKKKKLYYANLDQDNNYKLFYYS